MKGQKKMKKNGKKELFTGCILLGGFIIWTWLIQVVDVQRIGVNGTAVGFAGFGSLLFMIMGGVSFFRIYFSDFIYDGIYSPLGKRMLYYL